MATEQWLGIGAIVALALFIGFAFRQGRKVQPDGSRNAGPDVQMPPSDSSFHP